MEVAKSKGKDKIRMRIKKKKQQEKLKKMQDTIEYKCMDCGKNEEIPEDVVEYFDIIDDGDISEPPRFSCEECGGEMRPIKYTGVHGIHYS